MARYSYSGNKKHKKKQNHASEYLPYLINELADEIEIVEEALSGGEEGQVLTADSNGKAQWAEASEIVEQVLSGGEEGQVLTADSNGKAQWAAGGGGGGALASFSYEPGENETWGNLFVLYPAAAEALHLNLNEQGESITVCITLQLAESPYHVFQISRAFFNSDWHSKLDFSYDGSVVPSYNPPSGTYNILSVLMVRSSGGF